MKFLSFLKKKEESSFGSTLVLSNIDYTNELSFSKLMKLLNLDAHELIIALQYYCCNSDIILRFYLCENRLPSEKEDEFIFLRGYESFEALKRIKKLNTKRIAEAVSK